MTEHPNFADGRPIGQHMTEIVRGVVLLGRADLRIVPGAAYRAQGKGAQ